MLPWYIGLPDDKEHFEVLEAGTRTQLTIAHRDLVKPPATPSGHANHFGCIPYRFLVAVPAVEIDYTGASALANAILGRLSYGSPLVRSELSVFCGSDKGARHTYIEKTRARTMAAAVESLVLVEGNGFNQPSSKVLIPPISILGPDSFN